MPPTTAPERTGASGAYYPVPAPPPRRMLSPVGYLGLVVAALLTAFVILWIVSSFQSPGTGPAVQERYQTVDLGQFARELSPEPGALVREPFMLKVFLRLNPEIRDIASLKSQVERRRDFFRFIVFSEIIDKKSDAELRRSGIVDALLTEIKDRLNRELGSSRDGQAPISQVFYSERRLPERR